MTQVIVNTANTPPSPLLGISQLKHGAWYRLVELDHNRGLEGLIGICVHTYLGNNEILIQVISPEGSLSHESLKFIEIEKVTITY
jgi:hypothetical protein